MLTTVPRRTLAIDWGSEAVRAKLYALMEDGSLVDKILQYTSLLKDMPHDRREAKRQFTSHIYPFDITDLDNVTGKTVHPGNKRIPGRRSMSSKTAMYAVVGISDEVARQSPEFRQLKACVEAKPELINVIRLGIEELMRRVLQRVHSCLNGVPEASRCKIDAIALTVPAQWTIEFEEEYGERFLAAWAQVFDYPAPEIIFLSEGQTNVHYAFYRDTFSASFDREMLSDEGFFELGKTKNAVLVIDAGGHSTVSLGAPI